jgi:hypothetical protein
LEVSLSFDNAVVNATVLQRMNVFWQQMFLTVGIIIAVFGMRLIFPMVLVCLTAWLNPAEVIDLALKGGSPETHGTYGYYLSQAHPSIGAFGGIFLLLIFLDFLFEEREHTWLSPVERLMAKAGQLAGLSVTIALAALAVAAAVLASDPYPVMMSGTLGVIVYLVVKGLGDFFVSEADDAENDPAPVSPSAGGQSTSDAAETAGRAAFFLFIYLQVLDASFSFDGVIGAFAITQNIFIIAAGLGVGAVYIRTLTVQFVRRGTLAEYVYLEHGAHWAIGALAVILLISIEYEVPEVVTGLIGVGFIALAFLSSLALQRRRRADGLSEAREADSAGVST